MSSKKNKKREVSSLYTDGSSIATDEVIVHQGPYDQQCRARNDDVLAELPTLRKRSEELFQQSERKEREDKIDLQFVSDYMHNHCR